MQDTLITNTNTKDPKKRRNLTIALCIVAIVAIVGAVAVYLIIRPLSYYKCDFENIDMKSGFDWKIYNYRAEHTDENPTTIELVQGKDGSGNCLKIENSSLNDARIHKEFKVQPNSFYKVTLTLRTENVSDGAGANLSGYNMMGKAFSTTGTTDWRSASVYLETTEDQKTIDISLGLGGYGSECSGTAYFDDLIIQKVSKSDVPEGHVTLKLTPTGSDKKAPEVSIWFKILFAVVLITAIAFCVVTALRSDKASRSPEDLRISPKRAVWKRADVIIVCVMTVITALFSFIGMGSTSGTPNTYWKPAHGGESITVSFEEEKEISRIVYFGGIPGSGSVKVEYLDTDNTFRTGGTITYEDISFYKWNYKAVGFKTKTVRVEVTSAGLWLNELGFYENVDGKLMPVKLDLSTIEADYEETDRSGKAEYLFDEQSELRPERSYLDSTYFDEIYHPRTAYEQIHGLSIYERTHPPLGKVIMEIGILIFGMNTFGWRFSGVFFGVLLVPLIYAFALKVFKKSEWAFAASFLMAFDFMRLAQTRLATIDTYACFFSVAMIYFMYDYFETKSYERGFVKSLVPLALSGLMFGLGAASKWTCLYTGAALAILFFIAKIREILDVRSGRAYDFSKKGEEPRQLTMERYMLKNFLPTIGLCFVFFVFIPAGIYVLSYIPYMPSNPGKSLIQIVLDNQVYMYNYHSNLVATHSYSSMWYEWPIMTRPIWYYVGYNVPEGMRSTISSFGNPAIWWLGIPCLFASCIFAFRNKDLKMGFFAVAYALQYAPWILVNRVCFIYHYFSAFAFSIFFIVYVLKELTEKKIMPKWVNFVYLAIVLVLFIMFYPVLTGTPVPTGYVNMLKWFGSWSF